MQILYEIAYERIKIEDNENILTVCNWQPAEEIRIPDAGYTLVIISFIIHHFIIYNFLHLSLFTFHFSLFIFHYSLFIFHYSLLPVPLPTVQLPR
jgi:hypothetical protein